MRPLAESRVQISSRQPIVIGSGEYTEQVTTTHEHTALAVNVSFTLTLAEDSLDETEVRQQLAEMYNVSSAKLWLSASPSPRRRLHERDDPCDIPPISPLYLHCISPVSPLYLAAFTNAMTLARRDGGSAPPAVRVRKW